MLCVGRGKLRSEAWHYTAAASAVLFDAPMSSYFKHNGVVHEVVGAREKRMPRMGVRWEQLIGRRRL